MRLTPLICNGHIPLGTSERPYCKYVCPSVDKAFVLNNFNTLRDILIIFGNHTLYIRSRGCVACNNMVALPCCTSMSSPSNEFYRGKLVHYNSYQGG